MPEVEKTQLDQICECTSQQNYSQAKDKGMFNLNINLKDRYETVYHDMQGALRYAFSRLLGMPEVLCYSVSSDMHINPTLQFTHPLTLDWDVVCNSGGLFRRALQGQ